MSREAEAGEENGENQRTAKIQSCFTMHSTITIHSFRFWQGIVEIVARGVLLVKLLKQHTILYLGLSIYIYLFILY